MLYRVIVVYFIPYFLFSSIQQNSLLHFASNIYSKYGEDGVLEEVFKRLGIVKGNFFQIGETIGFERSLIRNLYDKGWSGSIIEMDNVLYVKLAYIFNGSKGIDVLSHDLVFLNDNDIDLSIEEITNIHLSDRSLDFLYIRTGGTEHKILQKLKRKPKVICIYGGVYWHPLNTKIVADEIALKDLQQPLSVMINIALKKGYRPICFTDHLILVRKCYMSLFTDMKIDSLSLWKDAWAGSLSDSKKEEIVENRYLNTHIKQIEDPNFLNLPFF